MLSFYVAAGSYTNDALLRSIDFLVRQEELDPLATRVSMLLLITDSDSTIGVTNSARILPNVRQANSARVSINAFALNWKTGHRFLDHLADQNRGSVRRCCALRMVLASELKRFYDEISRPLLENVRFRYDEQVDDTSLSAVDFPAYLEGSEIIVVGKLRPGATHLSVRVAGGSTQVIHSFHAWYSVLLENVQLF